MLATNDVRRLIVLRTALVSAALLVGCTKNPPPNQTASSGTSPHSGAAEEQTSTPMLTQVAQDLHQESLKLPGGDDAQFRQAFSRSLDLIARAVTELDMQRTPTQVQRVQIIRQASQQISRTSAGVNEAAVNTALRAAAVALSDLVQSRFQQQGEFVTLAERLRTEVDRLDSDHGSVHEINASMAVGHASQLISQMVANMTPPQPPGSPITAPTTAPAETQPGAEAK